MTEATVFVAAFAGSFLGMIAGIIPVVYFGKKKLTNFFEQKKEDNPLLGGMMG